MLGGGAAGVGKKQIKAMACSRLLEQLAAHSDEFRQQIEAIRSGEQPLALTCNNTLSLLEYGRSQLLARHKVHIHQDNLSLLENLHSHKQLVVAIDTEGHDTDGGLPRLMQIAVEGEVFLLRPAACRSGCGARLPPKCFST